MQPTLDANFHSYFVIMPCIEQISLAKISYRLFQRSYQYAITSDVDKTVTSDMKTCLKLQDQKTSSKYETKTKTCKFETKTLNFISFAKHFQKIKKRKSSPHPSWLVFQISSILPTRFGFPYLQIHPAENRLNYKSFTKAYL